jgi:hypothetical protein
VIPRIAGAGCIEKTHRSFLRLGSRKEVSHYDLYRIHKCFFSGFFIHILTLKPVQEPICNSEFGHIFGAKRQKPGFPLQSFGCAKRISATIPCAPATIQYHHAQTNARE